MKHIVLGITTPHIHVKLDGRWHKVSLVWCIGYPNHQVNWRKLWRIRLSIPSKKHIILPLNSKKCHFWHRDVFLAFITVKTLRGHVWSIVSIFSHADSNIWGFFRVAKGQYVGETCILRAAGRIFMCNLSFFNWYVFPKGRKSLKYNLTPFWAISSGIRVEFMTK